MATINTDIAQKIDVIARQNDTLTITLNISSSSGGVYNLGGTYILFNIFNPTTEDSILLFANASDTSGTLYNVFNTASVAMYNKFNVDEYTVKKNNAININEDTGVVTINDYALKIAPGNYRYKMIIQTTTNIKTWMHGKFKVNE